MPRLHLDLPLVCGLEFDLPEANARHLQVLRLQPGDELTLFNGQGGEYTAHVLEMGKRHVKVTVDSFDATERESPLQITLVQALSATERMDYTVQKATELGVSVIQIVQSAFCGYKLAADRAEKRLQHWQAVAEAAAEQCGRTRIPSILAPIKLEQWLAKAPTADLKLLLSPTGAIGLDALPTQAKTVQILIGPEGGFSTEEEASAMSAGFLPLLLGPRIFRTETVAPVVAALLQARYGDF
ncbi:16S rRNA (uracil(1498)-N(3))-methyltransferase [Chitinimonas sp. BJB300]|uniref:16S rRNA (uracil(1498)-N(3))-methyltransferase n=1 Tax=Chitinimonas sp. BJB300 TaxID=1559339 RepID=UPI000C1191E3|nr:16S rRNA (uracil(1498)-N(3))-methyltransferase [Chitinimonas sp. BJB300]PHV11512.1 16S rRNA (uracil(1498)-N(3))-methyltransferase [Chitinimonas sp. BJB300]TSJ91389.1 16S rRNA (uracil(1498)-N(3))-methyltransferase [Chitinimonas sp. BJB300]